MYDVITFGSATRDIFIEVPFAKIIENKNFPSERGLCLSLGSKLEVKNITFTTGGGATNIAASLASQGLKVAAVCRISDDSSGQIVLQQLKDFCIDTQFVQIDKEVQTAHSIILTPSEGERTILVFRGTSEHIDETLINFEKLKSRWFYVAPVAGNFSLLEKIFDWVIKNKIKILFNPGSRELKAGLKKLKPFLERTDVFILNQEEAASLTDINIEKEEDIFKKLDELVKGTVIMTKGSNGVIISDGEYKYSAGILKSKVIDRTGAGDAFGSGFLSGLMQKNDIVYAIQLGTANATSVIQHHGAKIGLLKIGQKFKKIKVQKEKI